MAVILSEKIRNEEVEIESGGITVSGVIILAIGISMMVFAVILFIISIVYRKTAGKRIREELGKEYGI